MMSVFTNLLLLAICLSMPADGALHKKKFRARDLSPNPTQNNSYPRLTAHSSSGALLSSGSATGSGRFPRASGTANIGSSFGVVPYPTEGAPYQNSSSLYTTQGNGKGEHGQSGSGNQCPLQQTVTLPPQTITLPAQTVTVTPAPETITITPQPQTETVTVTVTPQIQTTTVTVWMTVTANRAPSCTSPGNTANPPVAPVTAPSAQLSNTPIAPLFNNSSTPPVVPATATPPNLVVPLFTVNTVLTATATLPVIPNLGLSTMTEPATIAVNNQTSPVTSSSLVLPIITSTPIKPPYPYRNTTNQTLHLGSGSYRGCRPTGSGFAKPTNRHLSSYFVSKFVTRTPLSTIVLGHSSTSVYVPGNVSSLLPPPSQANVTTFPWTSGPTALPSPTMEYFPDNGSTLLTPPAQANATTLPKMEHFPDDGSNLLKLPGQANATNVLPTGGATAPVITPAAVGSSQKLGVGVRPTIRPPPLIQSNTSSPISPVSTRIPPLAPPTLQPATSISSTSQPVTSSTPPLCINGTTARNVTTNVRFFPPPLPHPYLNPTNTPNHQFSELPPIPSIPLIFQGLNYTTFTPLTLTNPNTTSPHPPPIHLLAPAVSQPKQIALAPGSLSFSLASLTLSCGDTPSEVTTNCTLQMFGNGAAATGSGTATGISRYVEVGPGMQTVQMEQGWEGLSKVSIAAQVGGTQTGLMLAEVVYEFVSAC